MNHSPNHISYFTTHLIYNHLNILILRIFKDKPGLCSFLRTKEGDKKNTSPTHQS